MENSAFTPICILGANLAMNLALLRRGHVTTPACCQDIAKEEDVETLKRKFPMFERVGRHFADVELVESHRIFVTKCMTHALKCVGVLTGGLLGIIYSMQWWVF